MVLFFSEEGQESMGCATVGFGYSAPGCVECNLSDGGHQQFAFESDKLPSKSL